MSHRHGDVERFGRWAPTYDRHRLQKVVFEPVQKSVLELAAQEVPNPGAILDVGCGTGRLLTAAADQYPGARLEGVDAAAGMIEQAKAAGGRANLQVATAERLPFPDLQFDLVFSTMTFHHWADQRQGIAEIARVLKPGGRWLLADFIATGPMRLVFAVLRPKRFHARGNLEALLAPSLRIVAERRVPGLWGQVSVEAIAGTS